MKVRLFATLWCVVVIVLAGCRDFSQFHFHELRHERGNGPPKVDQALAIANPPRVAPTGRNNTVKPVSFDEPEEKKPAAPMLQDPMRVLYQRAADRHAAMDSYIFRMTRREFAGGKQQPKEVIQVKLRRQPFSVQMKWLDGAGKGREAIYVQGQYENKIQLVLAANDAFPFSPAGMRFSILPVDAMARSKSRHLITETGHATVIEHYGQLVSAIERGDRRLGTAKYLGRLPRAEFPAPVETVHQVLPAGSDPSLPNGGERWWYFDPENGLPVLVVTSDAKGEVEYHCYDRIQWPVRLDDADFDPERVWRK